MKIKRNAKMDLLKVLRENALLIAVVVLIFSVTCSHELLNYTRVDKLGGFLMLPQSGEDEYARLVESKGFDAGIPPRDLFREGADVAYPWHYDLAAAMPSFLSSTLSVFRALPLFTLIIALLAVASIARSLGSRPETTLFFAFLGGGFSWILVASKLLSGASPEAAWSLVSAVPLIGRDLVDISPQVLVQYHWAVPRALGATLFLVTLAVVLSKENDKMLPLIIAANAMTHPGTAVLSVMTVLVSGLAESRKKFFRAFAQCGIAAVISFPFWAYYVPLMLREGGSGGLASAFGSRYFPPQTYPFLWGFSFIFGVVGIYSLIRKKEFPATIPFFIALFLANLPLIKIFFQSAVFQFMFGLVCCLYAGAGADLFASRFGRKALYAVMLLALPAPLLYSAGNFIAGSDMVVPEAKMSALAELSSGKQVGEWSGPVASINGPALSWYYLAHNEEKPEDKLPGLFDESVWIPALTGRSVVLGGFIDRSDDPASFDRTLEGLVSLFREKDCNAKKRIAEELGARTVWYDVAEDGRLGFEDNLNGCFEKSFGNGAIIIYDAGTELKASGGRAS